MIIIMNDDNKFSVDEILDEAKNGAGSEYYDDSDMTDIEPLEEEPEEPENGKKKKKKKQKRHFFGRKKDKTPDYDENEDAYYGMPVKPLSDLRRGFDSTGEITTEENTYANLFDDTLPALDEEMEKNFQRIQRERRRKVAEAVETAGVDVDEVADELGIVAPMPVTSFSADPYAKQHGISAEKGDSGDDFQRAMEQSATENTMEIKLNVLNDTVELQKTKNIPAVDEDTVSRILSSAEAEPEMIEDIPVNDGFEDVTSFADGRKSDDFKQISFSDVPAEEPAAEGSVPEETELASEEIPAAEELPTEPEEEPAGGDYYDVPEFEDKDRQSPNSYENFPQIDSINKYRDKSVPVHMMNIDILQSAILSEVEAYEKDEKESTKSSPFSRFKKREEPEETPEEQESIDDYTSPQDAKSVSMEIRGTMRELSLRTFVTGLAALVLFIITAIFESGYSTGDGTANPTAYIILSVVFLAVAIGFCYKSILSGLKALFKFRPTSDSAAAVAAVVVALQTLAAFLYPSKLASGSVHFYTSLVAGILFLNTAGKLTMVRRIHSNFRFVSSKEQKYAVKTYEDYNTSLKLAGDAVSGSPSIAYQKRAGFLKRFLQLSYEPDPSETASQTLAPLGLVLSLLLCLVCIFITHDIAASIASLAAATCISVSFTNMIGSNFPVSRLCKKARRAGAMVVGYNGIEAIAGTNAVMVDAADLFPAGTVVLDGVKGLTDSGVEAAVFSAAALVREIGGPIADVFSQVNDEDGDEHKVSHVVFEDENGVSGTVDGKSVIIGSRTILMNHGITPPERDEVVKYTVGGKKPLFVAVDGTLIVMLLLVYKADKRRKIELTRLEENDISLIVRSTDPNITPKFLGKLFGISSAQIKVISGELGEVYTKLTEDEIPRADALVATKGRSESMMSVISACVHEKRQITLITAMQNIAVILGFVIVAFLSCFSGIQSITALTVILYELFWLLVVVLVPKFKKF